MSKLEYVASTDTMYITLRDGMLDSGEDAGEDLVIHYSAENVALGYEIEHASEHGDHIEAALKLIREIEREARRLAA